MKVIRPDDWYKLKSGAYCFSWWVENIQYPKPISLEVARSVGKELPAIDSGSFITGG